MTENIRNQHKNTFKNGRPLGQTNMAQFGDDDNPCYVCGADEANHDEKICQDEYNG